MVALDTDERALYKEDNILGDNNNDIISNEEYLNLSNDAQKFYLKAEDVVEYEERVKDTHDHIFVKHDLFNHDPKMKISILIISIVRMELQKLLLNLHMIINLVLHQQRKN